MANLKESPLAKVDLNLSKINLKKQMDAIGFQKQPTQVYAVIDESPSMGRVIRSGLLEGVLSRVSALALTLDDDGKVPAFGFSYNYRELNPITEDNHIGYVKNNIRIGNGTDYSPVMKAVVRSIQPGDPALVAFFTDGENFGSNKEAEKILVKSSGLPIFWMFVGIHEGREPRFELLHKFDEDLPGRRIDNAGLMVADVSTLTEAQLYEKFLGEYRDFPRKAQEAGLLNANMKWTNNPFIDRDAINCSNLRSFFHIRRAFGHIFGA